MKSEQMISVPETQSSFPSCLNTSTDKQEESIQEKTRKAFKTLIPPRKVPDKNINGFHKYSSKCKLKHRNIIFHQLNMLSIYQRLYAV